MNNVLIRPLEVEDAQISWKWRNDPEIWKYTGSRPDRYITFEIENSWIKQVLSQNDAVRFAIMADDIYVGNIQLTNINANDAQYHIFIGNQSYWGKGIATLATQQILRYAKNTLQLKRVYLNVDSNNIAAIKAYEKCNFVKVSDEVRMEIDLKENINPKLSVFMMVYNHGKFLREAIDGILKQKCLFDFEIVVGEDFSKDDSRKILLDYADKYAGKFKLLLHSKNVGAHVNQEIVFENCTGDYVAMCEGDDYWTDPYKLQKQVDILEANPNLAISFHNVKVFNQFENTEIDFYTMLGKDKPSEITTLNTLLESNYIPTLSVVFRNNHFKFPLEFRKFTVGDWPLHILNARFGDIHFLNETMAVYRIHSGGVHQNGRGWSFKRKLKEINGELAIFKFLKHNVEKKFAGQINDKIKYLYKLKIMLIVKRYLMFEKSV